MKNCIVKMLSAMVLLGILGLAANVWALEIITEDDIRQGVIVNLDLIKMADNAIILFDSSSSMNKPYKETGMTRYDVAKKLLIQRNEYFPDLGYNFGLYLYTPWKAVYPVQKYDKAKFAQALKTLPEKATTATFLADGLRRLDSILKNLEGRTAVFLFTDGSDTNKGGGMKKPSAIAQALAKKYNVCFYIISTADDYYSSEIFNRVQDFNFCSRVIAYEDFVQHPAFNSEALFTVKATKEIVTFTDKRVVGIQTDDFLFDFDKFDLSEDEQDRLKVLAAFLKQNKTAYAALAGHTDSIGTEDYNMELSYKRVEMIRSYLVETLGVDQSQILAFWFGQLNPVADNATAQGRMKNRRVEILVGGM